MEVQTPEAQPLLDRGELGQPLGVHGRGHIAFRAGLRSATRLTQRRGQPALREFPFRIELAVER